jgi:hypothetical protein
MIHHKNKQEYAEVASHLFTDENEYYWKDHTGTEAAPPWTPGQQVVFKLKPWSKENTANRQQKRPRPPPSDGQDPLGPFLGQPPPAPHATSTGSETAGTGQGTQPSGGPNEQTSQYVSLKRICPTRQVFIRVMVDEQTIELKVNPKIVPQMLGHRVAQALSRDLPGWWFASVVDGTGGNQTYQEGDTIKLYAASQVDIDRLNAARTPKGSAALIPKAIGARHRRRKLQRRSESGFGSCVRGEKHRFTIRDNLQTRLS